MKLAFILIALIGLQGCSMYVGRARDNSICSPCIETKKSGFGLIFYKGNRQPVK